MRRLTFTGSPAEVGAAQAAVDPDSVRSWLDKALSRDHDFENPYFRHSQAFLAREFPDFVDEMAVFGEAAGIESLEQTYYLHVYYTGRRQEGCSALALQLPEDGAVLFSTNDVHREERAAELVGDTVLKAFPDARPHGLLGIGTGWSIGTARSLNTAGLAIGLASGHPKFQWPDDPETINLHVLPRLLGQHCASCDDVRHFLRRYRVSGEKGLTGVAVDAAGSILGFELESCHGIHFRDAEDGLLLEVNHWQHADLAESSRGGRHDFWESPYYYNSQNRVQHVAACQDELRRLPTVDALVDHAFESHAPGRLLQTSSHSIAGWVTAYLVVFTPADGTMRLFTAPLSRSGEEQIELGESGARHGE
jgi:hypothetical protein